MQLTKDTRRWLIQVVVLGWAAVSGCEEAPIELRRVGDGDEGDANAVGGALMGSGGSDQVVPPSGGGPPTYEPCEEVGDDWQPPCSEDDIIVPRGGCAPMGYEFFFPLDGIDVPSEELRLLHGGSSPLSETSGFGGQGGDSAWHFDELTVALVPEDAGVVSDDGRRFVVTAPDAFLRSSIGFSDGYSLEAYVAVANDHGIIRQRRVLFGEVHFCFAK